MTPLLEVLLNLIRSKAGAAPVAHDGAESDEPPAARTPDARKAARAELDRLAVEGEAVGLKLAGQLDQAREARIAAERALEDARKREENAKAARDASSWGNQCRSSAIRATLERGAPEVINQAVAELSRQWESARIAGRHIGAMRAPLSQAEIDDNAAADANLAGLVTAQQEIEALKFEALSDTELASAMERIIGKIPSRFPNREPVAIKLLKRNGGAGSPRLAHDGAKAVMA
jgi:hypothetical protein